MEKIEEFLLDLPLFRGVSPDRLGKAVSSGDTVIKDFPKGSTVFDGNTSDKSLGIILDGRAMVNNQGTSMRKMLRGSAFGVVTLFGGTGAGTMITADTDCTVLFMREDAVRELIMADSTAALNYITFLTDRINFLNSVIDRYTGKDVERNIRNYLYNMYRTHGSTFSITVTDMSRRLNVGRRSVYRALDALTESGVLSRNGKTITINEPEKLK
ncbi:MAG: Crp/Fnr family transcriptional regulator [Oscillospiraceae bacterium]|nr:Crp/Fnr family transcriptional regulator [Oscillospiraceae bacterium]